MPAAEVSIVNCAECNFENLEDARFCGECGRPLAADRPCPDCGRSNAAERKFCDGCGLRLGGATTVVRPDVTPRSYTPPHLAEKILQSRSALEGERKLVTVLFADVKGSMDLAGQLDAEEWHGILDRFFRILTDGVHRFEGTVNQYTGDGIMALFGAPIAHEDHARRACYTALELRDAVARYAAELKRERGLGFSMRMGIHSGQVVVGKIGDDLRMDYTAQGHTVGLAQRMESLASPDTCYLTTDTAALVRGFFQLEDLGDFTVKGAAAPVRVYRLVAAGRARTAFDVARARGLSRFVGRDADMAALEAALAQAQAGNGQVVGVLAEAGTGKSRLCFEFLERCKARGITVNQGAAVAHGKNVPYLAMLQVFRGYYGITDADDDRTARQKIAGRMLMVGEEFREELPLLFDFFGVPDPDSPPPRMDAEAARRRLFSVLRRVVKGADPAASAERFVTLIEDLHWIDPGSEAFLAEWVDAVGGSSSFLLVNFRPEYHAEWMQKSWYRQIPLAPLGPAAIRELLDDLIGSHPSTDGLAEKIHEKTGGNPFFAEEIVQTLVETGRLEGTRGAYRLTTPVEKLDVPVSVQGVLAARIDRLPEREKRVLQAAAVIGRELSEPVLLAVVDLPETEVRAALSALRRAELVYEEALYPVAEYVFKHALTQEVALGSQLRERRRKTHGAVADAIEKAHPSKLDEVAALIAHHLEEAGEALDAARWHKRAGDWLLRNDFAAAMRHFEHVLSLTGDLPAASERDAARLDGCISYLMVAWRVGFTSTMAEEAFQEGCGLAARLRDVEAAVSLRGAYGAALGLRGDVRRYLELSLEAASLVDESVPPDVAAVIWVGCVSWAALVCGKIDEAWKAAQRAVAISEGDPQMGFRIVGYSAWSYARHIRAHIVSYQGRLDDARAYLSEPIEVSRSRGFSETLSWALNTAIDVAYLAGENGSEVLGGPAHRVAAESLDLAGRIGSPLALGQASAVLGTAHLISGDYEAATRVIRETLEIARTRSGAERESRYLALLSEARLGAGDVAGALASAEEGVTLAEERGATLDEIHARINLARALRASSPVDEAAIDRCLARAIDLVHETDARAFEPQVLEEQARLAALRGDEAGAAAGLAAALELYRKIGATGHAARLDREIGAARSSAP